MLSLPPTPQPGDLITTDFIGQVLAGMIALDTRLAKLEQGTVVAPPARGFIQVTTLSADSLALEEGNATTSYGFTYELFNNTDQTLMFDLATRMAEAPSRAWRPVFEGTDGSTTRLRVDSGERKRVVVRLRTPPDARIGDRGRLVVEARVGTPHDKFDQTSFALEVAADSGPAQNRTIVIDNPRDVPGSMTAGEEFSFSVDGLYSGVGATSEEPFLVVARLSLVPVAPVTGWRMTLQRAAAAPGTAPDGEFRGIHAIRPARKTALFFDVRAPAVVPVGATVRIELSIESTTLPNKIDSRLASPIEVELA
ncbi:MAG: hypothetical protein JNL97_07175 [Verrucomicrobiales bacterium]|nr:hypothetical protein [Verrucomicrobiales bacterium]